MNNLDLIVSMIKGCKISELKKVVESIDYKIFNKEDKDGVSVLHHLMDRLFRGGHETPLAVFKKIPFSVFEESIIKSSPTNNILNNILEGKNINQYFLQYVLSGLDFADKKITNSVNFKVFSKNGALLGQLGNSYSHGDYVVRGLDVSDLRFSTANQIIMFKTKGLNDNSLIELRDKVEFSIALHNMFDFKEQGSSYYNEAATPSLLEVISKFSKGLSPQLDRVLTDIFAQYDINELRVKSPLIKVVLSNMGGVSGVLANKIEQTPPTKDVFDVMSFIDVVKNKLNINDVYLYNATYRQNKEDDFSYSLLDYFVKIKAFNFLKAVESQVYHYSRDNGVDCYKATKPSEMIDVSNLKGLVELSDFEKDFLNEMDGRLSKVKPSVVVDGLVNKNKIDVKDLIDKEVAIFCKNIFPKEVDGTNMTGLELLANKNQISVDRLSAIFKSLSEISDYAIPLDFKHNIEKNKIEVKDYAKKLSDFITSSDALVELDAHLNVVLKNVTYRDVTEDHKNNNILKKQLADAFVDEKVSLSDYKEILKGYKTVKDFDFNGGQSVNYVSEDVLFNSRGHSIRLLKRADYNISAKENIKGIKLKLSKIIANKDKLEELGIKLSNSLLAKITEGILNEIPVNDLAMYKVAIDFISAIGGEKYVDVKKLDYVENRNPVIYQEIVKKYGNPSVKKLIA